MPTFNKQYLLQLTKSLSLVIALTCALTTINPLLSGNPNWQQVIGTFIITLIFAVAHSAASHIGDASLSAVVSATLDKVEQILEGNLQITKQTQAITPPKKS